MFKGNKDRRAHREAARTALRPAHDPPSTHEPIREVAPEPVREPVREPTREPTREPAREPAREPVRETLNPVGWKYRGRSDSEAATSEPLQVPTGVPSQKEEGFRRFFKAVVTTTLGVHCRVVLRASRSWRWRAASVGNNAATGSDSNVCVGHGFAVPAVAQGAQRYACVRLRRLGR